MAPLPSVARFVLSLCLVLALVATPIRCAAASPLFYDIGFARHATAAGLGQSELRGLAAALIAYFGSDAEPFAFATRRVESSTAGRPLFNDRETGHLFDIKGLLRLVARVQETAIIVGLGAVVAIAIMRRGDRWRYVLGALRRGAVATAVLVAAIGVGAAIGFDQLFWWFHLAAFRNDLWLLDPRTDALIRLFPPSLFYEATLTVGAAIIAEAAVVYAATTLTLALPQKGKA